MDDIKMMWLYQYMERIESDIDNQYKVLTENYRLQKMDAVDIIEFVELQERRRVIHSVCRDLSWILKTKLN